MFSSYTDAQEVSERTKYYRSGGIPAYLPARLIHTTKKHGEGVGETAFDPWSQRFTQGYSDRGRHDPAQARGRAALAEELQKNCNRNIPISDTASPAGMRNTSLNIWTKGLSILDCSLRRSIRRNTKPSRFPSKMPGVF